MNDNRLGPLLIDSLDKPNAVAPNKNPYPQKKQDHTIVAIIVGLLIMLFLILLGFGVYRLSYEADVNGSQLASFLLWSVYVTPVFVLVSICCGGVIAVVRWLQGWATKNNIISLIEGPHVRTGDIRSNEYEQMLAMLANKMYDVAMKTAENSSYRGVQTLTLDNSTATTTQSGSGATDTQKDGNDLGSLYFNVELLDKINKTD